MTISTFNISLKHVGEFLKATEFLKQKGIKNINGDGVSDEFKHASQKSDYFLAYKAGIRNFDFDFLLKDESFFQFEFQPNPNCNNFPDVRYAYFQNPQEYKTYEEYLDILRNDGMFNDTNEDIGNIFHEDYEQYLIEQQINAKSTSIRYDVDFGNYKPLLHSVAHFHIGHQNDIRIPCDKVITPYMFMLFVLKHIYYAEWKDLLEKGQINFIKQECFELNNNMWLNEESNELYLK